MLYLIRPSRGKAVPQEVFGDTRPGVWVSDALGSQRGHGERWQMCLGSPAKRYWWGGFSFRSER